MVAYTYSKLPTANFNTTPPSIARSATGSVYDVGDTGFTTPLNMTMVVGGAVVTTISSNALGFLPDFTLDGRVSCVWKQSGATFATVLTTSDPIPGPASTVPGPPGAPGVADDASVKTLITTPGSQTAAALSATYVNLVSIKKFADGVGTGSELTDTGALLAAMNAAGSSGTVYFPAGNYKISSWPAPVSQATFRGDGESSVITYSGSGVMASLTNKSRVKFSLLKFSATDPNATLFTLSNSFRCSFVSCVFQGLHTPTTGATYRGQTAVRFVANAGDTLLHDCDILNFGKGVWTETIQNFMAGCKIGTCYYGIYGDTGAGFSVTQTDFVSAYVSDGSQPPVASNIYIPGAAGQWWLEGVWMEGADVAVRVGTAAVGGPTQFGMVNCKIAATTKNVDIQNARQPYMANIQTSENPGTTPTPYTVASTVTEGTVVNLVNITTGAAYHLPDATFPVAWTVLGRGRVKLPTLMTDAGRTPLSVAANTGQTADLAQFVDAAGSVRTWIDSQGFIAIGGQGSRNTARANFGSNGEMRITPSGIAASGFTNNIATDDIAFALSPRSVSSRAMVVRSLASQTADLVQYQIQGGTIKTAVNAGGVLIADDATAGIVLKSPNGHYWRQTISDTGVIAYADLGTTRPTT